MSLKAALASLDRPLTAAEQRVVSVLLTVDGADAPARSIAERAGAHETTVTRLAGKLDYSGYPGLRADLRRGNGNLAHEGARVMRSSSGGADLRAFVLKETPVYLPKLVGESQRLGGKTVMIGDLPGFAFRPQPNHLLAAPRDGDPEYDTTLVPALITYALQLAIYHLDVDRPFDVRQRLGDLNQLTGGQDEIVLRKPSLL